MVATAAALTPAAVSPRTKRRRESLRLRTCVSWSSMRSAPLESLAASVVLLVLKVVDVLFGMRFPRFRRYECGDGEQDWAERRNQPIIPNHRDQSVKTISPPNGVNS